MKVGIKVKPEEGSAVLFYDLKPSGSAAGLCVCVCVCVFVFVLWSCVCMWVCLVILHLLMQCIARKGLLCCPMT